MIKGKTTRRTRVQTQQVGLTSIEEKVVRMRHGLAAPSDMVLEQKGDGNPELTAELRAIEERALAAVGARNSASKRKIVNAIKRKS